MAYVGDESGNNEQTSFQPWDLNHSFGLFNAQNNKRLVVLMLTVRSGQVGSLSIATAATFNGVAATGSTSYQSTGGGTNVRDITYIAWWDDSALPTTGGSYTVACSIGNTGASPWGAYTISEMTDMDQTTPLRETEQTNDSFGTTTQNYTPSGGGQYFTLACLSMDDQGAPNDPTATTADTEIYSIGAPGANDLGALFCLTSETGGPLSATCDADYVDESWVAIAFSVDAAPPGETVTFSLLQDLYTANSFAINETFNFGVSQNLYSPKSFAMNETFNFSVSQNLYSSNSFAMNESVAFSNLQNLYTGKQFGADEYVAFNTLQDLYSSNPLDINESVAFTSLQDLIQGNGFAINESFEFQVSQNLYQSNTFSTTEDTVVSFNLNQELITGNQFLVSEGNTVAFSVGQNLWQSNAFAMNESVAFNTLQEIPTSNPFDINESVAFNALQNIVTGNSMSVNETFNFNVSQNLYQSNPIIFGESVVFNVSQNLSQGNAFGINESVAFNSLQNLYTGNAFAIPQAGSVQFNVGQALLVSYGFTIAGQVTIDGEASYVIDTDSGYVKLYFNGDNYFILDQTVV